MDFYSSVTRKDLEDYFRVRPRGLPRVLKANGIRLVAGQTRWTVVLRALGYDEQVNVKRRDELIENLLTADDVAVLIGVEDTSTVYKWAKGNGPDHLGPFPNPIDLSSGKKGARAKRWRRAEIDAWISNQPKPKYARLKPAFAVLPGRNQGRTQ